MSKRGDLDAARRELRIATHHNGALLALRHQQAPHRGGVCDCCGTPAATWTAADDHRYCAPCLDARIRRSHRAIQLAIAKCKQAGGKRCQNCGDFHAKDRSCDCIDPPGVQ